MSDQTPAQLLVEELQKIRTQAEEQLKATEVARKKADDDASYANQAKINTENHSKEAALLKGTAESNQGAIAADKQKADELLAALTRGKADIDADIKAINEHRKQVDQATQDLFKAAQTGAAHLKESDDSKKAAEVALKATREERIAAETAHKEVEVLLASVKQLGASITENHKTSTQGAADINKLLTDAQAGQVTLTNIVDHLTKSDEIACAHEARVAELSKQLAELNKTAEGLLPGFTSTGLAYSFDAQKKRFAIPQARWLRAFVWCMVGLIIVALPSFLIAVLGTPADSWKVIFQGMVMRLPIVIPLVWLAIYAGRNYMLSLRLEEDYAYKEALSRAFEGYKREMTGIPVGVVENPTPLTALCVNVLTAMAARPGRIYEGKQKDITLLSEANEMLTRAGEFGKKQTAPA